MAVLQVGSSLSAHYQLVLGLVLLNQAIEVIHCSMNLCSLHSEHAEQGLIRLASKVARRSLDWTRPLIPELIRGRVIGRARA